MRKRIATLFTADNRVCTIYREKSFTLALFTTYLVQVHSGTDKSVIIYSKPFRTETGAKTHGQKWKFEDHANTYK